MRITYTIDPTKASSKESLVLVPDQSESLVRVVIEGILPAVKELLPNLTGYLDRYPTDRWMLFSDYVLNNPDRYHDVYAFTLMPAGKYLEAAFVECRSKALRDFKRARTIDSETLSLLRDDRFFTVCIAIKKPGLITNDRSLLRQIVDRSTLKMEQENPTGAKLERLMKMKNLQQEMNAKRFNTRLLNYSILASTFAGYLTYLVASYWRATRIGWFSDRDALIDANDAIAHSFYTSVVAANCYRGCSGWPGPHLGSNPAPALKGAPWSDPFTRIPDYFAGAIAGWDFDQNMVLVGEKYFVMLRDVIAESPTAHVISMHLQVSGAGLQGSSRLVRSTRVSPSQRERSDGPSGE